MPSASSAAATRRRQRQAAESAPQPRLLGFRGSKVRVRWERLGRVVLLGVFGVVLSLYLKQGLSLLSTHSQTATQQAIVQRLARQNRVLMQEQRSLNSPATIERDARALGMVRSGERPYVVTGLPSR